MCVCVCVCREVHLRAREVAGRGPYLSSTPSRPVPRLIAYHPAIPLHLAHNMTAFQVLLRGLAQVNDGTHTCMRTHTHTHTHKSQGDLTVALGWMLRGWKAGV